MSCPCVSTVPGLRHMHWSWQILVWVLTCYLLAACLGTLGDLARSQVSSVTCVWCLVTHSVRAIIALFSQHSLGVLQISPLSHWLFSACEFGSFYAFILFLFCDSLADTFTPFLPLSTCIPTYCFSINFFAFKENMFSWYFIRDTK